MLSFNILDKGLGIVSAANFVSDFVLITNYDQFGCNVLSSLQYSLATCPYHLRRLILNLDSNG